ncbi:MAG: tripartite tricarboxylate transporter TctB family protein [Xanthobacteraceae bacterium]
MLQVKSPQDLAAGIVFIVIGAAGIIFGMDLRLGTAARMGPGYFPMLLSGLIIAIGLIVAARGFSLEGPPIERIPVRPVFFILGAILASGFLLNMVGLALTAVAVTIIAAYARRDVNLKETILLGVGMAIFSVVVFVYALNQPLPAWWGR